MNQSLEEIEELRRFPSTKLIRLLNYILNLYETNSLIKGDIELMNNDYSNLIKILSDRHININPQIGRYEKISERLYFKNE